MTKLRLRVSEGLRDDVERDVASGPRGRERAARNCNYLNEHIGRKDYITFLLNCAFWNVSRFW